MRANRLRIVVIAVLLLVPVSVTAGAEEPPQPAPEGKLIAHEGNVDLAKVSHHLLQARSMQADGASMADVAGEVPALRVADAIRSSRTRRVVTTRNRSDADERGVRESR